MILVIAGVSIVLLVIGYQVYRAECRVRQAKSKLKSTGIMYRHEQIRLQKILYENFY